jgi:hypothetical protein
MGKIKRSSRLVETTVGEALSHVRGSVAVGQATSEKQPTRQ